MALSRTIIVFLLNILFAQLAAAQDRFSISHFGTEDGLPSNGIKGLQFDQHTGFLWIATEAGVVRYNGINFKTYTSDDDIHISQNRVLFIIKNNTGKIYTSDEKGVIFCINENKLEFRDKNPFGLNIPNNLFALVVSEQLYNNKPSPEQHFSSLPVFDKVVPIHDTACLLIKAGALYFFSTSLKTPVKITFRGSAIASGFIIGNSHFLIDYQNDIFKFDITSRNLSPVSLGFPSAQNNSIFWENGMKNPILINGKNAWKLIYEGGRFYTEKICDTIPIDAPIKFVEYDEISGTIFLGSDSKGILIIKKNRVESLRAIDLSENVRVSYYSQIELGNGNVLTNEGHIVGKNLTTSASLPITGKFNVNLFREGDSVLWYSRTDAKVGYSCLHRYDFKTGYTKIFAKHHTFQTVMTMTGNGLFLIDPWGIRKLVSDSLVLVDSCIKSTTTNLVFDIKEIKPGILGIASCNGFFSYNIWTHKLDTIFNAGSYCVRTLWLYKDYLFFGTYGNGFYVYKNGKVKAMPLDKNSYLLFAHCFIEDDYGFCWISTNRGLFKVKIEDMIAAFENDLSFIYYHYFGKNDGMLMTEMNGGCSPCALKLKNKTISLPTMAGLLWVDPEIAKPTLIRGEIFFDEFRVNGKKINTDSLAFSELPASAHEIEIKLAYAAWENPENIYIEYQLDDTATWKKINPEDETLLRFINMSSGDHHLRIRKIKGFGINNYAYKSISFSIKTSWYEKWWFYVLSGLAFIGLIFLFIRIRTRQYKIYQKKLEKQIAEKTKELQAQNAMLEKNDSIKTRLISIINHDIITPLKFLAVTGSKLIEKKAMMSPELQEETIRDMTSTSKELQSLSTNILNWIKYQNEGRGLVKETYELYEMAEQVLAILGPVANQKKIQIINAVEIGQTVHQFFEPLKILLYNIVSNAINFSETGTITIKSEPVENYITLSVADMGIGMSHEQIQYITGDKLIIRSVGSSMGKGNGLGYLIIRDLLKVTEASLKIESKPGSGTTVFIKFLATG